MIPYADEYRHVFVDASSVQCGYYSLSCVDRSCVSAEVQEQWCVLWCSDLYNVHKYDFTLTRQSDGCGGDCSLWLRWWRTVLVPLTHKHTYLCYTMLAVFAVPLSPLCALMFIHTTTQNAVRVVRSHNENS